MKNKYQIRKEAEQKRYGSIRKSNNHIIQKIEGIIGDNILERKQVFIEYNEVLRNYALIELYAILISHDEQYEKGQQLLKEISEAKIEIVAAIGETRGLLISWCDDIGVIK